MFTELFGASYRYSGAGVGYQVASVVGGGFTLFIAAALVTFSGVTGTAWQFICWVAAWFRRQQPC
jgi:hypothetical protein